MKIYKKSYLFLIVCMLLFHQIVPIYGASGYDNFTTKRIYSEFMDVSQSDWFYPNVQTAFELNLMKGVTLDTFQPKGNLTVAQAITLAVRINEIYHNSSKKTESASSGAWYLPFVSEADKLGLIYDQNFSDYNKAITRSEFARIFVKVLPYKDREVVNPTAGILNMKDVDSGTLGDSDFIKLYKLGIMTGDTYMLLKPNSNISRAEAAAIISRIAKLNQRKRIRLNISSTITKEKHINRNYDWFIDQNETGKFSADNCGPCVTSMILKWYNPKINISPQTLRSKIRPQGGWWYTDDIEQILNENAIPYQKKPFQSIDQIITELDNNKIVLVCVDGYYFSQYYTEEGSGHFMILKGYVNQNGTIRFETYNPDSRKDSYYFANNIKKSADIWWPHYIVIGN